MKCAFCESEIKEGETVCSFCGEKVEWPEGAGADAASSETSAPPVPETPAGPVFACVQCGKVYPAGTKFCSECGGRVQEVKPAAEPVFACVKCGKEYPAGTKFCSECGGRVQEVKPEAEPVFACVKCGKVYPAGTKFCGECGGRVQEVKEPVFACVKCGKEYPAGTKFCGECGGRVQEANADESEAELEEKEIQLPGGVALEMVKVEAGSFTMGSPEDEEDREDDETQHRVTLTQDYWLGKYAVTQAQWEVVMGGNPSYFEKGGDYPVENVCWDDAMAFCRKLNKRKLAPSGFRFDLPTEAQWEYAARGGRRSEGFVYSGSDDLDEVAWHDGNSNGETHPVGEKEPNELGLFDMSGNVWEWCRDWDDDYDGDATDPAGPKSGGLRVCRGGGWNHVAGYCRVAIRFWINPSFRFNGLGFRVALVRVQ